MNVHTIKFRIIVLALMLIVVGVVVRIAVALPSAQDLLRHLVAGQQLSIASYIARDVGHSIDMRRAFIRRVADSLPASLLEQPEALSVWLDERRRITPLFNNDLLVVRVADNRVLSGDPGLGDRPQADFVDSQWFQAALKAGAPVIGKPWRGSTEANPIIVMAMPVRDANQRVVAVLAGVTALRAPGFLDEWQGNKLGRTGGFLLISPDDGVFIGASDPGMVLQSVPALGVNPLHDRAMAGYRGTGITHNAQGVEELAAIVGVPGTPWFVVARMPTAEAFSPIRSLYQYALTGTGIVLFVVLGLLLLFLPRILRPLTQTARAMREMADGTRPLEPLKVERKDEVGSVLHGFNVLVERLQEKERALKESEARMAYLAHHDSLTGLYNRQMLEMRLQHTLEYAQREGTCFALLFCDLDYFKPINDTHGHDVGDQVLLQVASRLLAQRRRIDTVARLGGDEFVILLSDMSHARHDAQTLAQQYLEVIARPYIVGEHTLTLSTSIGIAVYQGVPISISQLLSQADTAMYQAKRAGKNSICFFDAEVDNRTQIDKALLSG